MASKTMTSKRVPLRSTAKILGLLFLSCGAFLLLRGSAPLSFAGDGATAAAELKVSIKEWDVPTKGAHPHDTAVGGGGRMWFTEQMQNKIRRSGPKTG